MSADGLRKAVLDKARAEADEIVARATSDTKAAVAAATDRAGRTSAEAIERAKREVARVRARELSSLDRELRLDLLKAKNAIVDSTFDEAAKQFARLAQDELRALYAHELANVALDGATLAVAPGAAGLFDAARSRGASVREDASVGGGYVVERAEFRLDRTLAARLDELRSSMRGELARELFREQA